VPLLKVPPCLRCYAPDKERCLTGKVYLSRLVKKVLKWAFEGAKLSAMVTCDECGKELKNRAGLYGHVRMKHQLKQASLAQRNPEALAKEVLEFFGHRYKVRSATTQELTLFGVLLLALFWLSRRLEVE